MSGLNTVRKKTEEGVNWRGTIHVSIDGEEVPLTVRQLVDPEYHEVMSMIDKDELQELREQMPQDVLDEYRELQNQEELDEEESERLEELQAELEDQDVDFFEILSDETFEGIRQCAKYCVEPDEEDLREAFASRAPEIEAEYGVKVETPSDIEPALQDEIEFMIDKSTDFVSFAIGIQCLVETVGEDEGNSED